LVLSFRGADEVREPGIHNPSAAEYGFPVPPRACHRAALRADPLGRSRNDNFLRASDRCHCPICRRRVFRLCAPALARLRQLLAGSDELGKEGRLLPILRNGLADRRRGSKRDQRTARRCLRRGLGRLARRTGHLLTVDLARTHRVNLCQIGTVEPSSSRSSQAPCRLPLTGVKPTKHRAFPICLWIGPSLRPS